MLTFSMFQAVKHLNQAQIRQVYIK